MTFKILQNGKKALKKKKRHQKSKKKKTVFCQIIDLNNQELMF